MGNNPSCPAGSDQMTEQLYKSELSLCITRNTILVPVMNLITGHYDLRNITIIQDISGASAIQLTFLTMIVVLVSIILVGCHRI